MKVASKIILFRHRLLGQANLKFSPAIAGRLEVKPVVFSVLDDIAMTQRTFRKLRNVDFSFPEVREGFRKVWGRVGLVIFTVSREANAAKQGISRPIFDYDSPFADGSTGDR